MSAPPSKQVRDADRMDEVANRIAYGHKPDNEEIRQLLRIGANYTRFGAASLEREGVLAQLLVENNLGNASDIGRHATDVVIDILKERVKCDCDAFWNTRGKEHASTCAVFDGAFLVPESK